MKAALATYLHDHLAGADLAVEILERLEGIHEDAVTAELAADLLVEVTQDRDALRRFAASVGSGSSGMEEAAAWLSEKALRLKLAAEPSDLLGRLETLEFLALGTLGKVHLWRALQAGSKLQAEAAGLDLSALIARGEGQHARLDERRLQIAALVLTA